MGSIPARAGERIRSALKQFQPILTGVTRQQTSEGEWAQIADLIHACTRRPMLPVLLKTGNPARGSGVRISPLSARFTTRAAPRSGQEKGPDRCQAGPPRVSATRFYFLSNTIVLLMSSPFAFLPFDVIVMTLPSLEITRVDVTVTFPAFFSVDSAV